MNPQAPDGAPARPLRLAGPPEFTTTCVLPALGPLVAAGMHLKVNLGRPAEDLLAGLAADRYDLAVSTIAPEGDFHVAPLFREEFVLVGTARWSGALPGAPLLAYASDLPVIRSYWKKAYGTPPPRPTVTVPDLRGVLALAAAGAGVTVLPRYLCHRELSEGVLVELDDPAGTPVNQIYLATGSGARAQERAAPVVACLLDAAPAWAG